MGLVNQNMKIDKGMIKVCILDILESATEESPLSQDAIRQKLESLYGIKVDRKTVSRNLSLLCESVEAIQFREIAKGEGDQEISNKTDFYLKKEPFFEEMELLTLIYDVIFSRNLPKRFKRDLLLKLESLTESTLHRDLKNYIFDDVAQGGSSNELTWNLEMVNQAIANKRMIEFGYKEYVVSKELRSSKTIHTISPLAVGVRNNRLYLFGIRNGAKCESPEQTIEYFKSVIDAFNADSVFVSVFALDRMTGIEVLEEPSVFTSGDALRKLDGRGAESFNPLDYFRANPTLQEGYSIKARLFLPREETSLMTDMVELFGENNVHVETSSLGTSVKNQDLRDGCIIKINGNANAIFDFVLEHGDSVRLLDPAELRTRIKSHLKNCIKNLEDVR